MDNPKNPGSVDELDAVIARDLMVPMRDGVRLATDNLPARARRRSACRQLSNPADTHAIQQE